MDNEIISDKISDIGLKATKEVIRLADEAGEDRDRPLFIFASGLFNTVMNGTFANFKLQ